MTGAAPVRDRGQVVALVGVLVASVTVAVALGVAELGRAAIAHQRAATAADAAALAALDGGAAAAERVAVVNGATLDWIERSSPGRVATVTVRVSVGGASATARATNAP